tara:strand:- start:698 stop:958 length:261 start_codon:yes stop_codon:yes gene_type:complete
MVSYEMDFADTPDDEHQCDDGAYGHAKISNQAAAKAAAMTVKAKIGPAAELYPSRLYPDSPMRMNGNGARPCEGYQGRRRQVNLWR